MSGAEEPLSDAALARLRVVLDEPDLTATRYELAAPLGRGGMGTVWRARDRALERDVALKVLALPAAPGLAARLVAEAKILARLDHPGIVPVHDVGVLPDGRVFYAMKLVAGARLDEFARGDADEAERLRVFGRIVEAVAFAHAHGVIHCDLKPANIMVGAFGEVLVMDWGVAKVVAAAAADERAQRLGTPGWMAPEQARGDLAAVDARSDVFALGALLRFLLTEGRAERPPKPLAAVAAKALAELPERRYESALALLADVRRYQSGAAVAALPEGPAEKLARFYRRHRAAVWLVGTYMVARTLFLLLQSKGRGGGE